MASRNAERERFFARLSLLLGCALLGVVLGGVASRIPRQRPVAPPVPVPTSTTLPVVATVAPPPDLAAPAPPAGVQPSRELWVLVVDQSGQPIEGVSVLARPGLMTSSAPVGSAPSLGELGVLPGPLPFPEEIIAGQTASSGSLQRGATTMTSWVAKSDAKGLVHFVGVASGRLLLLANYLGKSASNEVEVPSVVAPAVAEAAMRVVLRLASPVECAEPLSADSMDPLQLATGLSARTDLRGRVVDHRGFAVSTARIDVQVGSSRSQASCDTRGQFVLPLLPAGEARLSVRAPGFAPLQQSVRMEQRRDELRVELRPGGGLAGLIEDVRTSGLPEGIDVWLELPSGERWPIQVAPDGHFSQTGLPTGQVVVRARARGYAPVRQAVQVPESLSPDQITVRDVRLRFVRGAQLMGQVRGPSGNVEGAEIQVLGDDAQMIARTRSDRRGEFELVELPPGRLRVQVSSAQGSASLTVELRSGDRQRQDIDLGTR